MPYWHTTFYIVISTQLKVIYTTKINLNNYRTSQFTIGMDDLVRELNNLRIARDEAAREYHRTVQESSTREQILLTQINSEQRHEQQFQRNILENWTNPIVEGDIVRITNNYNTADTNRVCCITNTSRRMVELRCVKTNKYCKRVWWNLERVENTETQ